MFHTCLEHGYYTLCNCASNPATGRTSPPGELIYRLSMDRYQRPLPDDRNQIVVVSGDRYRVEKKARGFQGPDLCPMDYTEYWVSEAQRGSHECWIETWHPEFPDRGDNATNYNMHPDWGRWTNNRPAIEEKGETNATR